MQFGKKVLALIPDRALLSVGAPTLGLGATPSISVWDRNCTALLVLGNVRGKKGDFARSDPRWASQYLQ